MQPYEQLCGQPLIMVGSHASSCAGGQLRESLYERTAV